jgi:hypothetical protein
MSPLRLNGSTSGYTTLDAPAVAGSNTLVLPTGNGSSGQFLQTNGSGTLSWAGGGKILQVVQGEYSTAISTASTSYTTTNLTASITPSNALNKVLILVSASGHVTGSAYSAIYTIFRGTTSGTNLGNATWGFVTLYPGSGTPAGAVSITYLDSPSTTSSQTYTYAMKSENAAATAYISPNGQKSTITLLEIAA